MRRSILVAVCLLLSVSFLTADNEQGPAIGEWPSNPAAQKDVVLQWKDIDYHFAGFTSSKVSSMTFKQQNLDNVTLTEKNGNGYADHGTSQIYASWKVLSNLSYKVYLQIDKPMESSVDTLDWRVYRLEPNGDDIQSENPKIPDDVWKSDKEDGLSDYPAKVEIENGTEWQVNGDDFGDYGSVRLGIFTDTFAGKTLGTYTGTVALHIEIV